MLTAVRYIERRPATETNRGRPPQWSRSQLLRVASSLRSILERETSGRISLSSFIGQYLRILDFPVDVVVSLEQGEINLQEATQLARISAKRLGCSSQEAFAIRAELLKAHLQARGSENSLRRRVKEILGEIVEVSTEQMTAFVEKADELLEIDPSDKRHLFYEEMRRLFFAMRDIQPEDLDDHSLENILSAADQLSAAILAIQHRRSKIDSKKIKLSI